MKKDFKIKTKEVPRIVWYIVCPICGKEISGNYEKQAIRNFEAHLKKHKKGDKKNGSKRF